MAKQPRKDAQGDRNFTTNNERSEADRGDSNRGERSVGTKPGGPESFLQTPSDASPLRSSPESGPVSLAETAAATARSVAGSVAAQAKDVASSAVGEVAASAEAGVAKGADSIDSIAGAMKSAARELETSSPFVADSVRGAADHLEAFTRQIRGRSLSELATAGQDLARSNPILFAAGAAVAGFALARFLKSGAPRKLSSSDLGESGRETYPGWES